MLEPWLYLTPSIALIALVMLVPLAIGITYSFQSIILLRPMDSGWVGFENYAALVDDSKFWKSLRNTLWWTFGSVFFQFFLGLGLALAREICDHLGGKLEIENLPEQNGLQVKITLH